MDLKQVVMLALQVSILATVFGFGLKTRPDDLAYLFHRPGLLVRSVLSVLVIVPILAFLFVRMFDFRPTAEIALIALAISPVPPLLPQKEAKAGGRQSYGLALMAVLAALAIVAIPLWLAILQQFANRPLAIPPGTVARVVIVSTFLPLALGVTTRAVLPALADRIERPIAMLARILLPTAVIVLLAGIWREVWGATGAGTILAMIAFVAAGLLVGHLMGGPDPEHSVVLALSSACRHPAIALTIASSNFPDQHFAGTILLFLIVNALVGIPYLAWHKRQHKQAVAV
jgi:bile acid:Na+ symporter, BASS family